MFCSKYACQHICMELQRKVLHVKCAVYLAVECRGSLRMVAARSKQTIWPTDNFMHHAPHSVL